MNTRPQTRNVPANVAGYLLHTVEGYFAREKRLSGHAIADFVQHTRLMRAGTDVLLDQMGKDPQLANAFSSQAAIFFENVNLKSQTPDPKTRLFHSLVLSILLDEGAQTREERHNKLTLLFSSLSPEQLGYVHATTLGYLDEQLEKLTILNKNPAEYECHLARATVLMMTALGPSDEAVETRIATINALAPKQQFRFQAFALRFQADDQHLQTLSTIHQNIPMHPDLLDHDAAVNRALIHGSRYRLVHKFRIRHAYSKWDDLDIRLRERFARKHISWLMARLGRPEAKVVFVHDPTEGGSYSYARQWEIAPEQRSPNEMIIINRGALKHFLSFLAIAYHEAVGHGGQTDFSLRHEKSSAQIDALMLLDEGLNYYVAPKQNHLVYFVQPAERQAMLSRIFSDAFLLTIFSPQEIQRLLVREVSDYLNDGRIQKTLGKEFCLEENAKLIGLSHMLAHPDLTQEDAGHLSAIVRGVCKNIHRKLYPEGKHSEVQRGEAFIFGRLVTMSAAFLEAHIKERVAPRAFATSHDRQLIAGLHLE